MRRSLPWSVLAAQGWLVLACRGDFDANDASSSGTGTTETSTGESGNDDLVEPCDGCPSGYCEVALERCALAVFATRDQFIGNEIGGLDAADDACQLAAGGPAQPFRAWLSTDDESAPDHVNLLDARVYVLPDGTVLAEAGDAFRNAGLLHAIDQGPDGMPLPDPPAGTACAAQATWTVWTGTRGDATPSSANCGGWDAAGVNGAVGRSDAKSGDWTNACTSKCTALAGLYCFEDAL